MSKAPKVTRLSFGRVSDVVVDDPGHVIVTISGCTERDASHEIRVRLMVGQLPYTVRKLWAVFAAWRRAQRSKIEQLERAMTVSAELGEKEGDQP